ncbi:MAG: PEP-CTERM sorting domain-containing protein [Rhizonema sp. PD37]|nr:PEP-CTERM sorting domain-containing protein [Rhizonema sp. PD37]
MTEKIMTATGLQKVASTGCNVKKDLTTLDKLRKNFTKATGIAAAIGIAACLFPATAQAQIFPIPDLFLPLDTPLLEFSGNSDVLSNVNVNFLLNPSVENTNSQGPYLGVFPGAILNFTDTSNSNPANTLTFSSGTLTASRLTTDPNTGNFTGVGNFSGFEYGYSTISDNTIAGNFSSNSGLRYDVTFDNSSERLTLFIPSTDPNLSNSLSGLITALGTSRYSELQGVVTRPDGSNERFFVANPAIPNQQSRRPFRVTLATVPEPTTTASLLAVGALGAVSVLKRNWNVRKSV